MDCQELIDVLKERRGDRLDLESIVGMMLVVISEMDEALEKLEDEVERLKLTGKE